MTKDAHFIDSSAPGLRKFGFVVGGFLGILGGIFLWRGKHSAPVVLAASTALLFFAAIAPSKLKWAQKIWMSTGFAIGAVMTRVILCVIYYLFLTPLAVIARLAGHDFLRVKTSSRGSYWLQSHMTQEDKRRYRHQF